ncbi:hypothetical protein [Mycoplasma nasistruthionis]|uniref:Uncharacterized protein n=1 Tax=Mycoplasma nasistruthionis TaxID=353852 RepID=A0A4Y6I5N1_9MOLU|nr:hypothetical protein [Mycoplasma nasistruthionis]QDF64924.1 hypothetical protein FIV53_01190 [Mycoplasma nasistruthionis]
MPELENDPELVKKTLQTVLSKQVWDHLSSYDKVLEVDYLGKTINAHLWEYFFPYYIQDMVVAYNVKKTPIDDAKKDENDAIDLSKYQDQPGYEGETNSIINALKIVKDNIKNKSWIITDAIRDNMLYGSSYWLKADGQRTSADFTGEVTDETYKSLIDSFTNLIQDGTGYSAKDSKHITFNGDGLEVLETLVNPTRNDVAAAIMYNGDAIDAYYAEDNFPNNDKVADGDIRVIKPKQNILLVDGFILSSANSNADNDAYIEAARESFLDNLPTLADNLKTLKSDQKFASRFNDSSIENQQRLLTEYSIAQLWRKQREINFASLYSEDITSELQEVLKTKDSDLETETSKLVVKYGDLIDLSLVENSDVFNSFYNSTEETDYSDKINITPKLLQDYFVASHADLLSKVSEKLINAKQLSFDENSDDQNTIISNRQEFLDTLKTLLSLQDLPQEQIMLVALLLSDIDSSEIIESSFINYITGLEVEFNEQNKDDLNQAIALYLGRKIAFLDLSDKEAIASHGHLTNFDFVNYVPSQNADYQLVLRNYFADVADGQDKNVIDIYQINSDSGIVHKALQPIDDELNSKASTYYFTKTKS